MENQSLMHIQKFKRIPNHIGIIPDGNRRWAVNHGLHKHNGYHHGIEPGFMLYDLCVKLGIQELTFYGFTQDNTKRPSEQKHAFSRACVDSVSGLSQKDAQLLVMGDNDSKQFPKELMPYTTRKTFGKGLIKINFLVNYGWEWDLNFGGHTEKIKTNTRIPKDIASADISRIDLILRWGGRRRLSGFLPVQTIYSDFYVIDDMWPDFKKEHFYDALKWYQAQDITLGG
jgi:undecaprenyl diphosphate synthase